MKPEDIVIGGDYEWLGGADDVKDREPIVLRVESVRQTRGKEESNTVTGLWFSWYPRVSRWGEGFPAYADDWTSVKDLRPWTGDKPKRIPLHAYTECLCCGERDPKMYPDMENCTTCCESGVNEGREYGGEHDDACVCTDCEEEKRRC